MNRDHSARLVQTLIELARNVWEGEEASGFRRGMGVEGVEDAPPADLPVSVALCCMDEALNRKALSALRGQPMLPATPTTVRREGLFTLMTVCDGHGGTRSAFHSGASEKTAFEEGVYDDTEPDIAEPDMAKPDDDGVWGDRSPGAFGDDAEGMESLVRHELMDAACGLYLISAKDGWRPADAHLFARLRSARTPLMILCCLAEGEPANPALLEHIGRQTGVFPQMLWLKEETTEGVPSCKARGTGKIVDWMAARDRALAICLAQELPRFRAQLAGIQVREAAIMAGVLGAEPAPLIDIPLLLLVQVRAANQLAAMYARPAPPFFSQEGAGIVTLGLCTRYLAQQLVKFIPFIGWLLSALLSGLSTWLLGKALIRRFEGRAMPDLHTALSLGREAWAALRRWRIRRRSRPSAPVVEIARSSYPLPMNGDDPCSGNNGDPVG